MTPEETLAIKTITLEKVRRQAMNYVSPALLAAAELDLVTDALATDMVRSMFRVDMLGKPEKSEWSETTQYPVWGVRNGIRLWLRTQWPFSRMENFDAKRLTVTTHHHHAIYHMCPHVNDWTGNAKLLHLKFLESTPVPNQTDEEIEQ